MSSTRRSISTCPRSFRTAPRDERRPDRLPPATAGSTWSATSMLALRAQVTQRRDFSSARGRTCTSYTSEFRCGPDSSSSVLRQVTGRPWLTLQFDAHGNDAGAVDPMRAYRREAPLGGGKRIFGPRGQTLWIPRSAGGAEAFTAACRSLVSIRQPSPTDARTYELAEGIRRRRCLPGEGHGRGIPRHHRSPGFDISRRARADDGGPCRFRRCAPFMRHILDDIGLHDLPSFADGARRVFPGRLGPPVLQVLGVDGHRRGRRSRGRCFTSQPRETEPRAANIAYENRWRPLRRA